MSASPELTKAPHELSPWRIRVTAGRVVESHGKKMASPSPSPSPSSPSAVRILVDTACQTPESKESRIPPISGSCPPPAPRKPKRTAAVLCKRRLSELEVFKIEGEDLEKFFMPHSVIKKQKKQQDHHDHH